MNLATELVQVRRTDLEDVLPRPPISLCVLADATAFVNAATVHGDWWQQLLVTRWELSKTDCRCQPGLL